MIAKITSLICIESLYNIYLAVITLLTAQINSKRGQKCRYAKQRTKPAANTMTRDDRDITSKVNKSITNPAVCGDRDRRKLFIYLTTYTMENVSRCFSEKIGTPLIIESIYIREIYYSKMSP